MMDGTKNELSSGTTRHGRINMAKPKRPRNQNTEPEFHRTTFQIDRALEYFSEKELSVQIGSIKEMWPLAVLKELVDNALDACETAGSRPEIRISITNSYVEVKDNGGGIPSETISRSFDYGTRTSDKQHYISPTRGQLGNALKTIWAAPLIVTGQAKFEIETCAAIHEISVGLDRVTQRAAIEHKTLPPKPNCKNGTKFRIYWNGFSASLQPGSVGEVFYKTPLKSLVQSFALCNPHATFTVTSDGGTGRKRRTNTFTLKSANAGWMKWRASMTIPPHWYTAETLRSLIAAYVINDRQHATSRTVRAFVSEFRGLSSTIKQKRVTSDLTGVRLENLVRDGDIDLEIVASLLDAMKNECAPVPPKALGILGRAHVFAWTCQHNDIYDDSFTYERFTCFDVDGLPVVFEIAFAAKLDQGDVWTRVTGMNFTPTLSPPIPRLERLLGQLEIHPLDSVVLIYHIVKPRFHFTDKAKSNVVLSEELFARVSKAVRKATKAWTKMKRASLRRSRGIVRRPPASRSRKLSIRAAAFTVMEQAYLKASANERYHANARQVYYAARPLILALTGAESLNSGYFTQTLLKDYLENVNPDLRIVWDARGHLTEPHTGQRIGLGGREVARYRASWIKDTKAKIVAPTVAREVHTSGPVNQFSAVLFIEKEGFDELLFDSGIGERYDLAIVSTKGVANKAACDILKQLEPYARIFVVHDFDKSGFTIVKTLREGVRLAEGVEVIDLGFRLNDVKGLESEPVSDTGRSVKEYLESCEATPDEIDFLIKRVRSDGKWEGDRVELNAMTSDELVRWLEEKLDAHGVTKVIPDRRTLRTTYRQARLDQEIRLAVNRTMKMYDTRRIAVPRQLIKQVQSRLDEYRPLAWDAAVREIAEDDGTTLGKPYHLAGVPRRRSRMVRKTGGIRSKAMNGLKARRRKGS